MDQLFLTLVGKPKLNPSGKLITLVAENFSILEDQAKFLKATLAIPTEKQLPLSDVHKRLIQVGTLHADVKNQLEKAGWSIDCDEHLIGSEDEKFFKKLEEQLSQTTGRSLICINDGARIQLLLGDVKRWKRFLRLLHKWKSVDDHFVVVLFQKSQPNSPDAASSLRDLEYISDGYLTTKSFKDCYLQSMWFKPVDRTIKTLIPLKIETHYYTCKIGKSYWSPDLLCFYERNRVTKSYDPDSNDNVNGAISSARNPSVNRNNLDRLGDDGIETALSKVGLDEDEDQTNLDTVTLPYIKAQNPEQSRIFYYPDKDDDVDEDDPDDDLGI